MIKLHHGPIGWLAGIVFVICVLVYLGSSARNAYALPSSWSGALAGGGPAESSIHWAGAAGGKPYGKDYKGHSSPADINRVANTTLGFDKVFVVGLPERTDKRDAIGLSASLTGFEVEWIDGVRGKEIPDKAVPFGANRTRLMETGLGSWRGHMNAIRRIVDEGLESALIMEDDMDWDVRLKPQLELVAAGTRQLMADLPDAFFPSVAKTSSSGTPISPYGNDWDILWLGHCGEHFPEAMDQHKDLPQDDPALVAMSRKYTITNDPSVPPRDKITGYVDFKAHPEHTRWVHHASAPLCTFAYALSQRGAQKVLFDLSVDRLDGAFDNALANMCRRAILSWPEVARWGSPSQQKPSPEELRRKAAEGPDGDRGLDAKCLAVTPPLFFHHKSKGLISSDSDIQKVEDQGVREKGSTENIVWSARNNLRNMLMGLPMENKYDE